MELLAAALFLLQAAPSEADKLEAALKKFGDRTYKIAVEDREAGTLTLKTRIEKGSAVFEDRYEYSIGDQKGSYSSTERVALDRFKLQSITAAQRVGDHKHDWQLDIAAGKATLKKDAESKSLDAPAGVLGEMSLLRRVCTLEQKEGTTFEGVLVSVERERLESGPVFKCEGRREVTLAGRKVEATVWQERGEVTFTPRHDDDDGDSAKHRVSNTYWVHPDGYLLRFTSGELEMTLVEK